MSRNNRENRSDENRQRCAPGVGVDRDAFTAGSSGLAGVARPRRRECAKRFVDAFTRHLQNPECGELDPNVTHTSVRRGSVSAPAAEHSRGLRRER